MIEVNDSYPESWHKYDFHAMGSEMSIWLETADSDVAAAALAQVKALFEANEQALSRFRPDSELSQLNARSGQWVVVSDLLWDVLTLALGLAEITNGRFDPTTLNALEYYGYSLSFEPMARLASARPYSNSGPFLGNWTAVELDHTRQAINLPGGIRVDLGGIAKGYTAQQAVDSIRSLGPCLVDAGGDLVAGAAPIGYPGWPVAISTPWTAEDKEQADLCELWLADQALATSGIDYRTWERDGRLVHHLIDPATGAPAATDGLTMTILADDAAQAEVWATATLIAGSEAGMDALLDVELAGLMVTQAGGVLVTPLMHRRLQGLPTHQPQLEWNGSGLE
jgi:thiamine biosynthesis lipoprotein